MAVIQLEQAGVGLDSNGQLTTRADVIKRYLLKPLSVTLTEQRIGIIGANGSGKSTFIRLLNGLIMPSKGDVWVDSDAVRSDLAKVRTRVGFVFQNPEHQIIYPLVHEDIAYGLNNMRLPKAEVQQRTQQALVDFGLSAQAEQSCYTLSGGQKQLLALAGVVVMRPDVIILDEPTTLLDLHNRLRVQRHIACLEQQVIQVSHHLDELAQYERVLCFDQGELVDDGAPAPVIERYVARMQALAAE